MLHTRDIFSLTWDSLGAFKLRVALTVLGLTMGVATLITVMTLIQGANVYVAEKIANLGTDVFQIARTPFAVTDFEAVMRSMRYKYVNADDMRAVEQSCRNCRYVGAHVSSTTQARYRDHEVEDVSLIGQTPNMVNIDTRTVALGRFFTETEDKGAASVCLLGDALVQQFFAGQNPLGRIVRVGNAEFTVIGTYEKIGAVLGQDQDNFAVIPLNTYLKLRGSRLSLTLNVRAAQEGEIFDEAIEEARLAMRARRGITGNREEDFFIGTKESYIAMWESISSAFFIVFITVSGISALVGGIVIMNVMLVSVTERTAEIGVRRAVGATRRDILRQFLIESVMQCLVGGAIGVISGFLLAVLLRNYTAFPADVQTWVAGLGLALSSAIGLFFGIYPALKAARLDPVVALRSE